MSWEKADVLICGGGIIGLTIARELLRRGHENIVILEKESEIGKHASGRSSGVLHAGIYYASGSLKAKLCLRGNYLMKQYCHEKGLQVLETGKVIVTKNEQEIEVLKQLYATALTNGAKVDLVDEKQMKEFEPYAKTCGQALYSHYTAVVDPKSILDCLYDDLVASGKVKIYTNSSFQGTRGSHTAVTNSGDIGFGLFINAAGAYSDTVAHSFGIGLNYRLIPFKGTYRKLKAEKSYMVRGNIYPVPDLRNPFLGVHFTRNVCGDVYIGPTAIPAFGRENYGLVAGLDTEALRILYDDSILFMSNSKFRNVALTEPMKYLSRFFFNDAACLLKDLKPEDIERANKCGIRPQLVDWESKELVMDFVVVREHDSLHVLNAISPAFTSSMAFAEYIAEKHIRAN
jgi:(S)-2-hydroxyglutarate dehydrogenase